MADYEEYPLWTVPDCSWVLVNPDDPEQQWIPDYPPPFSQNAAMLSQQMYCYAHDRVGRSEGTQGFGGYPLQDPGTICSGYDSQIGSGGIGWEVLVFSAAEEALVQATRNPPLGGIILCNFFPFPVPS